MKLLGTDTWLQAHERAHKNEVRLYVYELPGCPACRDFREKLLVPLQQQFSGRLIVIHADAARLPLAMARVPTVVMATRDNVAIVSNPFEYNALATRLESGLK